MKEVTEGFLGLTHAWVAVALQSESCDEVANIYFQQGTSRMRGLGRLEEGLLRLSTGKDGCVGGSSSSVGYFYISGSRSAGLVSFPRVSFECALARLCVSSFVASGTAA